MKYKKLIITAVLLGMVTSVTAANDLSNQNFEDPGAIPGDLTYSLETFSDNVRIGIASAPVIGSAASEATVRAEVAEKRLAESVELLNRNRSEKTAELANQYRNQIQRATQAAEKSRNSEAAETVENVTKRSSERLQGLIDETPDQANQGLRTAFESIKESSDQIGEDIRKGVEEGKKNQNNFDFNIPDNPVTGGTGAPSR